MKKIRLKSLVCALAALAVSGSALVAPAFANSAAPWESGVTANGVTIVNESSVLEVESENLTFDIANLPKELKEGEEYNAQVTAEYSFYNPTENTITTKMAFPIGETPDYVDVINVKPIENPITVDGQPIGYSIRHTYASHYDFEKEARKIQDDYVQSDFYKLDTPVTEYHFTAHVNDKKQGTIFSAPMPGDGTKTKYLCRYRDNEFNYYLRDGDEFIIYVLGENVDISNLEWKCKRYNAILNEYISVNGSVTCNEKVVTYTLKEHAFSGYNAENGISEVDWYNGYYYNYLHEGDGLVAGNDYMVNAGGFTSWYIYETVAQPGERFTNAVTAPLFPSIHRYYEPAVYGYTYYLSPASGWASFKNLTINVNCDFFLNKDALGYSDSVELKKVDGGYTAFYETLPEGELRFGLCSVENPEYNRRVGEVGWVVLAIIFAIFIWLPLVASLIVLVVGLAVRNKNKNKAEVTPVSAAQVQAIKYCRNCGKQLAEGVSYCPYCGTPTFDAPPEQPVQPTPPEQPVQPAQPAPPVYQQPRRTNGHAVAGFVLSIVSFASSMYFLCFFGVVFGIFGLLNVKRCNSGKGLAIAGVVIGSIISAALLVLSLVVIIALAVG